MPARADLAWALAAAKRMPLWLLLWLGIWMGLGLGLALWAQNTPKAEIHQHLKTLQAPKGLHKARAGIEKQFSNYLYRLEPATRKRFEQLWKQYMADDSLYLHFSRFMIEYWQDSCFGGLGTQIASPKFRPLYKVMGQNDPYAKAPKDIDKLIAQIPDFSERLACLVGNPNFSKFLLDGESVDNSFLYILLLGRNHCLPPADRIAADNIKRQTQRTWTDEELQDYVLYQGMMNAWLLRKIKTHVFCEHQTLWYSECGARYIELRGKGFVYACSKAGEAFLNAVQSELAWQPAR